MRNINVLPPRAGWLLAVLGVTILCARTVAQDEKTAGSIGNANASGLPQEQKGWLILEGKLTLPEAKDAPPRGLYIESGTDRGAAILISHDGSAELGQMKADGSGFKCEKRVDRQMTFGRRPGFRLLLKHSLLEFYLNDILIECFSLPGRATGRIGLIGDCSAPKAWECNPAAKGD